MNEIGKLYSFEVYAPTELGKDFVNLELMANVSYSIVSGEFDAYAVHKRVYADLPAGTPENPEHLNYLIFRNNAGEKLYIAQAWVIPASIKVSANGTVVATIPYADNQTALAVRELLSQGGFKDFKVELV